MNEEFKLPTTPEESFEDYSEDTTEEPRKEIKDNLELNCVNCDYGVLSIYSITELEKEIRFNLFCQKCGHKNFIFFPKIDKTKKIKCLKTKNTSNYCG